MIDVTMTLHSAITGRRSSLCRIVITNDGTGTRTKGNYNYTLYNKAGGTMKTGKLLNYSRLAKSPVHILHAVLNHAYPQG